MSDEAPASNAGTESVAASVDTSAQAAPVEQQQVVDDKPSKTTRDALERAFTKVGATAPDAKAQQQPTTRDDNRNADGTFKPKAGDAKPVDVLAKPAAVQQPVDQKPAEVKPSVGQPPAGFTKAAQDAWAQTPDAVRADTERRIGELTQGLEKYKTGYEPIAKYDKIALESGTTLAAALDNYYNIEQVLKQDFVGGIKHICQNLNVNPMALAQALAGQAQQPGQQPRGDTPEMAALKQEIAALKGEVGNFGKTFAETRAQETVNKFAETHPHFDDLADSISHMLNTRFAKDLQDAYDKAVRLNPEVAAKIEADKAAKASPAQQQPDPVQTREKANKSITGTPSSGSNPASRKPAGSPREALQSAFAQVGL